MYNNRKPYGLIAIIVVAVLLLGGLVPSIRIVDANETCAITVLGDVVGEAKTGFQLVKPYITSLDCYPRQVNVYSTAQNAEGDTDYTDYPVEIKTADGQTAYVEFNVSWSVPHGNAVQIRSEVAANVKDLVSRVIGNYARSVPRDLGPQFTAEQLYGVGRTDYEKIISEELALIYADYGVVLDRFVLRDINFDPDYETAIEAQQIARERIETEGYNADAAVNTARGVAAAAKGQADAEIQLAIGYAESVRIRAAADAEAMELRGEALQNNPQILNLEFIEALESANWMMVPWDEIQGYLPVSPDAAP